MIDVQPLWDEIERKQLTALSIAMHAGVHVNTVHRVLSGEACNTDSLEAIAKALGFKVELVKRGPKR